MKYRLVVICVASSLSGASAWGQAASPSSPASPAASAVEAAREHYRRGKVLFDLQRYLEAAKEYEAAYELKDDPALLFNIGQAYRLANEPQKAIGAYKSYLRNDASVGGKRRAEIEARIGDLQKLANEQQKTQDAPPQGTEAGAPPPLSAPAAATPPPTVTPAPIVAVPTPQDSPSARRKRWLGIGLMAGGGAALVAGGTLTGLAYGLQSTYSHPSATTAFDPSAASRMQSEQIAGGVMLGLGAAAAVGGAVVYWLGRREARGPHVMVGAWR
jgi:tetratricopeptide (TPR) repeat protein